MSRQYAAPTRSSPRVDDTGALVTHTRYTPCAVPVCCCLPWAWPCSPPARAVRRNPAPNPPPAMPPPPTRPP
ncbi:MAG TPA: hypothetical protein DIV57_07115, partial [Stenotrophomonas sp.]|nr:hypothetical protein [Stenotrophomonas sp.]